jgi:tetratricopeptide (TPR) repeat protein
MSSSRDQIIYQQIDAYVKGTLSDKEIDLLWEEFAKDPELLERLELEVGVKKILADKTSASSKKASVHSLPNWVWHFSAAATILLVALVQLFRVETPTDLKEFVVSTIPADQFEVADGLRSQELMISSADSLLNLGFAAISSGNEEQAMAFFNEVITNYNEEPYASKAYLNKGIILYNDGEYTEAISSFKEAAQRARDNRMISEKAFWYLGNAYVNTGQPEEALTAVGEAYNRDGVFRKPAFVLYQKLSYDLGKVDFEDAEGVSSGSSDQN